MLSLHIRGLGVGTALRPLAATGGQFVRNSSVMRHDETTGNWIVFAGDRKNRPHQTQQAKASLRSSEVPTSISDCPFCFGNEHLTPDTLLTIGEQSDKSGVRVVPNKYPAVSGESSGPEEQQSSHQSVAGGQPCTMHNQFKDGLVTNNQIKATGSHEVVIESPRHNAHIGTEPQLAENLMLAWRERGRVLQLDDTVEHLMFFKVRTSPVSQLTPSRWSVGVSSGC